ncbi:hypothetical protein [Sutterella sp.]|uniref:hypothetical protein n=1 Tax=Sutterella sp. TaxID=1981025 RepID=UPI0026DF2686|nr:hypothetical protein [Sutterella sp.]MDO5531070.1 hypothetical protein [Sutterella sp.]
MSDILSSLSHAGLALAAQTVLGGIAYALGCPLPTAAVIGGAAATGFYYGREVAQAERKAGTPPWYSGFLPSNWSQDNALDFAFPALACAAVIAVAFVCTGGS